MKIDGHLHLSIMQNEKDFAEVKKRLLSEMVENNIDMAVVIPDNLHNTSCADLDTLETLLKEDNKFVIAATLHIDEINSENLKKIAGLFESRRALGFKIFPGHDPVYPTDQRWAPIIELCKKHEMPFLIHTGGNLGDSNPEKYNDPKYIAELAEKHPKLNIILCHFFWPHLDYCLERTVNYNNIYFDTSALAHQEVVKACGGIEKIKNVLKKVMEINEKRLIFGTDWPIVGFRESVELIKSLGLSENQEQMVFCNNAKQIFGIKK